MIPSMGDSMDGLSEIGERRSRVASTSSLAQVVHIVVVKMKKKDEKHVDAKFFNLNFKFFNIYCSIKTPQKV